MGSTLSDILGLSYGFIYQGILSALKKNIGKLDLDILTENCGSKLHFMRFVMSSMSFMSYILCIIVSYL